MVRSIFAAALVATGLSYAQVKTYDLDVSHSSVTFEATHMTVSTVPGKFTSFSGSFAWDDKDLSKAKIAVTVQPASVDTGTAKRDGHLQSPDFFDVAKYSNATFVVKGVKANGKDSYTATADLTIRGVTKTYTFPLTVTAEVAKPDMLGGGFARGLSGAFSVKRKDFGLGEKMPSLVIGEDIAIKFTAELVRK